jgi:hypothetical protein
MSRILRRPMFRGGSTSSEGIMSVPRKGYQTIDEEGVQPDDTSSMSSKSEDLSINPSLIRKETQEIKNRPKTYKALGQEIEEGSYGDLLMKEYLGNRPDPLGKFLIQFGLNYMSARPKGGKFGALATAAESAKKPTEQLYADIDTDRLLKLKLMGALSKSESSVTDVKRAKAAAETRNAPNSPYKGLSYDEAYQRAYQDILRGSIEKKKLSVEEKISDEYKNIRSKAISTGSEIRDMNKAEILQRDRYKLKNEVDKLASTNTFGIPDNITKLPNSTDYTIPNAKKNDLDSFKVGRIYVDSDSRMSFEYLGNNIFRPKIKL